MDLVISAVTHRSGSTLLQRVCCARPGTLIWGEHDGALSRFIDLRKQAMRFAESGDLQRERYFNDGEDPNRWIATMNPDAEHVEGAVVASARAFLECLYSTSRPAHDVVGFKEVRYGRDELALLRACYPQMHLVLLVRDPVATWRSISGLGAWRFGDERYGSVERFVEYWDQTVRDYVDWSRTDPRSTLVVHDCLSTLEADTVERVRRIAQVSRQDVIDVVAHRIRSAAPVTPSPLALTSEEDALLRSGCGQSWNECRSTASSNPQHAREHA